MINNINIINYIQLILNKKISDVTINDFKSVKSLVISKMLNGEQVYNLDEILLFENLDYLLVLDSTINNDDIQVLANSKGIKNIVFKHCYFQEDVDYLKLDSINSLKLEKCFLSKYSILTKLIDLKELSIIFPYGEDDIDLSFITYLDKLETLELEGCIISDINCISNLTNLKKLSLLYTSNDIDLEFLSQFRSLKKVYVSSKNILQGQYDMLEVRNDYSMDLMDDENYSKGLV